MKHPFRLLTLILSLTLSVPGLHAQNDPTNVNWREARITDVGAYLIDLEMKVMENPVTHTIDTITTDNSRIVWASEGVDITDADKNTFHESEALDLAEVHSGDAAIDSLVNSTRKGIRRVAAEGQSGCLQDVVFNKFYYNVFKFEYPSVDANGDAIMLSAMAACPTKDGTSRVNNVILGTHITITSDKERPSAQNENFKKDDWGMIFSLAAGNKMSYKSWTKVIKYFVTTLLGTVGLVIDVINIVKDIKHSLNKANCNNCLVIMPDYEGYGLTRDRAHPYLYQELTARQSVDALLYGKSLYISHPDLEGIRHPLRNDYRCMSVGYSQGGSVSMACHRFIEQNGLSSNLHFVGSLCGDGPYDPMATLMYYVQKDLKNDKMSMAVVLPLIMKGMLDTNPYMKNHTATDYFTEKFLNTGIMNWLTEKEMTTDDIKNAFKQCYYEGYNGDVQYFRDIIDSEGRILMRNIMNEACYTYFVNLYNANKDNFTSKNGIPLPAHRGVYEDLHFALASNDMTKGWAPKHTIKLFHSKDDTVVPFVNATSAKNRLGEKVSLDEISGQDHIDAGSAFFSQNASYSVVLLNGLRLCEYVNDICGQDY